MYKHTGAAAELRAFQHAVSSFLYVSSFSRVHTSQVLSFDDASVQVSNFPFRSADFRELTLSESSNLDNMIGNSLYYTRYNKSVWQDVMGGDMSTSCVTVEDTGTGSGGCVKTPLWALVLVAATCAMAL